MALFSYRRPTHYPARAIVTMPMAAEECCRAHAEKCEQMANSLGPENADLRKHRCARLLLSGAGLPTTQKLAQNQVRLLHNSGNFRNYVADAT